MITVGKERIEDRGEALHDAAASGPDFRTLFESAPGLYLVLAPDFKIVAVSNNYLRATMTKREEILGRGIFDVFPDNPDDVGATGVRNLQASLERVLQNRAPDTMAVQKYDIRRPESEGGGFEERHWSPVNSPVLGADGVVAYIIHRVEDVTEFVHLKQRGVELGKLTQELRSRAEQTEVEVYLRAREVQATNRKLEEAYKELAQLSAKLEDSVAVRTAQLGEANRQLQEELANRTRLEKQLLQSQKMEAVGRLAGGIAHDFNNLLTVIEGYSSLLIPQFKPKSESREQIEEVGKAADRAAALTRKLLAFSRQQILAPQVLDLDGLVAEMGKMLRRVIGEDIELVTVHGRDLGRVKADPGEIEQVILNLAVNARDAMPRGGKLTIETANVTLDAAYSQEHLEVAPGPYVMLAISDTGVGMDAEIQAHIFEPFFTTKERGKGTGLGLATVYGVVKQSGGSIWLYSEPDRGTTFKIYLPRVEARPDPTAESRAARKRKGGTETILLVEDEESVRALVRMTLRSKGYTVLEACHGVDALKILNEHPEPVHLLLTDVVMPKLSGPELAEGATFLRPDTRVLYMSGYADDAVVRHGILVSGSQFLQKPFRPDDLLLKVREVLDNAKIPQAE